MEIPKIEQDICIIWDTFEVNTFNSVHFSENHWVYKLSLASNPICMLVASTQFFNIYKVTSQSMTNPAGFIFSLINLEIKTSHTARAISARADTTYNFIKESTREEVWTNKGIQIVNYYNTAEVITDLGSILNVSIIK